MFRLNYLLLIIVLSAFGTAEAQRTYREHLRSGNSIYADSIYDKSEIEYRKAIELNPKSADAHFNLGNALMYQNKHKEAIEEYKQAQVYETDKNRLSQIYHNMGVAMQLSKDYENAVNAYKQSLIKNPHDNETRYNLAMLLKQQQQQQDNQQQDNQENQDKKEQEEQQQQQEQQDNRQQDNQQQQQQQQNQQQEKKDEMSEENAQQLLQSAMQDEKDVQEKVKRMMQLKGRKLEKDW